MPTVTIVEQPYKRRYVSLLYPCTGAEMLRDVLGNAAAERGRVPGQHGEMMPSVDLSPPPELPWANLPGIEADSLRALYVARTSFAEAMADSAGLGGAQDELVGDMHTSNARADVEWLDYFVQLLADLVVHRACSYEDRFGDITTFTTYEEWLDAFAAGVLDPLAERWTELALTYYRGELPVAEECFFSAYQALLSSGMADVLTPAGYAPIETIPPDIGVAPVPPVAGLMQVVSCAGLPEFEGFVVGTRQFGLMRGRRVYRIAQVITG